VIYQLSTQKTGDERSLDGSAYIQGKFLISPAPQTLHHSGEA
jgi:hypothetical protein